MSFIHYNRAGHERDGMKVEKGTGKAAEKETENLNIESRDSTKQASIKSHSLHLFDKLSNR